MSLRMNSKRMTGLLAAAGILLLNGCGQSAAEGQAAGGRPAVPVEVVTIKAQPVDVTSTLPGRTSAYRVAEVRPQVEGIILKRLFKEGSKVKAGDVLYQIDPATYKASLASAKATLASAEASLESARLQYERYQGLIAQKAISQQEFDDAQATYLAAKASVLSGQAAVKTATINLNYTRVKAPISGQIGRSSVTEGALVTANQTTALATIQQLDPLYVDLSQPSHDLIKMRKSAKAAGHSKGMDGIQVMLDDGTPVDQSASLQFADVTVNEDTATVTVRALIDNPTELLLPGLFVRASVPVEHRDEGILVPQVAVSRNPLGNAVVMVVGADNTVEQRVIDATQMIGSSWLVDDGLKAGERVIVSGLQNVAAGATVSATESAPAAKQGQ